MGPVSVNIKTFRVFKTLKISISLETLGIAVLLSTGLILRLWQINGALWYDEAFSAWLAQLRPESIIEATLYDVHPPAYYLLLRATTGLWGLSVVVLRLPSVLAGLFLIIVVHRLGKTLGLSHLAVWLATALTTMAPFQIYYSGEVRFYALQTIAVALAALGLVEQKWWLLVTGSLAALYLHNVSVIFIASLFIIGLIFHPGERKPLFITGVIIALGFLPGAVFACYQAMAITNNYWIPGLTNPPGRVLAALDDLIFFMTGSPFVIASALATSTGLIIIALAPPRMIRQSGPHFLLLAFTLPVMMITFISLIWQPIILSRTMAPIAPLYYLILAWSVTQTRQRLIFWLAVTTPALIAILIGSIVGQFGHKPPQTDYLNLYGLYRPGDAIYHANPGSYLTFKYYRSDIPQFVWSPNNSTLSQMLTPETRRSMGMHEIDFDLIKCVTLVDDRGRMSVKRWWLIEFDGPTTTPAEMNYVRNLTSNYPSKLVKAIHHDKTLVARLWLIEPKCKGR